MTTKAPVTAPRTDSTENTINEASPKKCANYTDMHTTVATHTTKNGKAIFQFTCLVSIS